MKGVDVFVFLIKRHRFADQRLVISIGCVIAWLIGIGIAARVSVTKSVVLNAAAAAAASLQHCNSCHLRAYDNINRWHFFQAAGKSAHFINRFHFFFLLLREQKKKNMASAYIEISITINSLLAQ